MKTVVLSIIICALPFLNSCSKDEQNLPTSKNVTYEAIFDKVDGDSDLILKGEYIDKTGKKINIDTTLPFKMEIKDVPENIKTGFKGYVFSIKAAKLIGTIKMTVVQMPKGRIIYDNVKTIKSTTNNSLGFTGEELRKTTSFDFRESN